MDTKEIRFIDSSYNELFRIPDGGYIYILEKNTKPIKAMCKYVDDRHVNIEGRNYNLLSWARFLERNNKICSPIVNFELSHAWFNNKIFVKKNYEAVNQDKFFKTDYGFKEVYYNPDSTAGGQLVYNEFPFELIREAAKEENTLKFFEHLYSCCKQTLMDVDSPYFMDYVEEFINRDADYLKDNKETANAMIKAANEDKKYNKTEPER